MTIIALYVSIRLIYAVRKMTVYYYNTGVLKKQLNCYIVPSIRVRKIFRLKKHYMPKHLYYNLIVLLFASIIIYLLFVILQFLNSLYANWVLLFFDGGLMLDVLYVRIILNIFYWPGNWGQRDI